MLITLTNASSVPNVETGVVIPDDGNESTKMGLRSGGQNDQIGTNFYLRDILRED